MSLLDLGLRGSFNLVAVGVCLTGLALIWLFSWPLELCLLATALVMTPLCTSKLGGFDRYALAAWPLFGVAGVVLARTRGPDQGRATALVVIAASALTGVGLIAAWSAGLAIA